MIFNQLAEPDISFKSGECSWNGPFFTVLMNLMQSKY